MSWHVTLNRKVKCVVDYTVLDAMLTIRFCWKIPFLNIFRRTFNGNVMLSNAYRFSVANAQKELHQMAVTEAIIGFICNRVLNIHLLQYWLLVKQLTVRWSNFLNCFKENIIYCTSKTSSYISSTNKPIHLCRDLLMVRNNALRIVNEFVMMTNVDYLNRKSI